MKQKRTFYSEAAYAAGKAETLYLCVDLSYFTDEPEPSQLPPHLFRTDPLSRLRYLLSYEVWFRYLPVDLGLLVFDRLGLPMPRKFADSRSIDRLENWSGEEPVGEEVFLHNVWVEAMQPHKIDEEAVWREMQPRIDAFLDRFDFDYGTCFSTYAVPKIAGEIRRFLRDDGPVKIGRGIREKARSVYQVRAQLQQEQGREPTLSEIADATGFSAEEIARMEIALCAPESLQQP